MSDSSAGLAEGARDASGGPALGDPDRIGEFRVIGRLGAGGMGVVYRAVAADATPVAVKLIRAEYADDADFRRRFAVEVTASQRVSGRCTARVLAADPTGPRPYLVTEYVPGPSLSGQVGQHGPLPAGPLRALAMGLAEALIAIHAEGLVHRDLKPSNVLLSPTGPKVIDFGIASAADATAYTRTGLMVGSPGWMAPEQASGQIGRDPAIDVFAWGLVIAFAATGRPPFGEGRPEALVYRIVHSEPDLAGLDPQWEPLVRRALAKEPAARPTADQLLAQMLGHTTADTATAVTQVLEREWSPTLSATSAGPPSPAGDAQPPSRRTDAIRRSRERAILRLGWLVVAVAACAVIVIGYRGRVFRSGDHPRTQTASPPATRSLPVAVPRATLPVAARATTSTPPPTPTTAQVTQEILLEPFAGLTAQPRRGLRLVARMSGACHSSVFTTRDDAFRCFANASLPNGTNLFDPCFTPPLGRGTTLVCPLEPWTDQAVQIAASQVTSFPSTPTDPRSGNPIFLTTVDGHHCRIIGGATYTLAGLGASYGCDGGGTGFGSPDRTIPQWIIEFQPTNGSDLHPVAIATAWF